MSFICSQSSKMDQDGVGGGEGAVVNTTTFKIKFIIIVVVVVVIIRSSFSHKLTLRERTVWIVYFQIAMTHQYLYT